MSWQGIQAALFRRIEINLPSSVVEDVVTRHGAHEWFVYAHTERKKRWHVWWPSLWLAPRLAPSSQILETGCGCGLNLLWFGEQGFQCLYGTDIDEKAISAGVELFQKAGLKARLWVDDGLLPTRLPSERFDVILALNWTYHVESFEIAHFLNVYRQHLNVDGYLVMDLIDSAYNKLPNNQYLTSDWDKPEERRAPTEYKHRYSENEVFEAAARGGYEVIRSKMCTQLVPRRIYILSPCH